jgi:hypothetical protein
LHNFGQQRLVINYRQADLSDNPTFYISNRLIWQAAGITRIRRHRWPVEVYHEEGVAWRHGDTRPKDWTGINCGTSTPFNDMSPWSPWSTRYCAPPNMTLLFTRSFTGFFTSIWKTIQRPDVERLRHNPCGAWAC